MVGVLLPLTSFPPLAAQTSASGRAAKTVVAADPAPARQAPDEVIKTLSDLIHAGKYADAQQLTAGSLLAYPSDQRLIKAKALLDNLAATADSATATPISSQPTKNVASAHSAANTTAEQLTGMGRVDYDALIVLGRQAQQTTDLSQQTKSLQQFMDQSGVFLQKHPAEILLWQLRAASAMVLNDPLAGYDAGQKLLALGVADSNDANSRRLLAQLKNKGWLDAEEAKKQAEGQTAKLRDISEGAWVDTSTGLMWMVKLDKGSRVDWNGAQGYCRSLMLGGFSNWRLATIRELQEMYDSSATRYKIGGKQLWVWSGTKDGSSSAWSLMFGDRGGQRASIPLGHSSFQGTALGGWSPAAGCGGLCVRRAGE